MTLFNQGFLMTRCVVIKRGRERGRNVNDHTNNINSIGENPQNILHPSKILHSHSKISPCYFQLPSYTVKVLPMYVLTKNIRCPVSQSQFNFPCRKSCDWLKMHILCQNRTTSENLTVRNERMQTLLGYLQFFSGQCPCIF